MVQIPLPPRSHHKANKLTDEEQEKRNKLLERSYLTKGWVKKKKTKEDTTNARLLAHKSTSADKCGKEKKESKNPPESPTKKELEKQVSGDKKKHPAQKFYEEIVWGDVKMPTKFDKFIVTGKIVEVEVYERTLTAQLAKASTYICRQARRWYEEEIVDDIAEWYKRWEQHPFTSRLAAIEKPYKDADYSLTYMNMTAFRDNLKDGYKEMLRVANQCDRERIDYRGDLPTAPIREFKAAAAEFYEVVNAVCIKSNVELDKLTKPASGKAGETHRKKIPSDLIDLAKAVGLYHRSRAQIKRDINDGKIRDYRKIQTGKHWISKKEADNLYISK